MIEDCLIEEYMMEKCMVQQWLGGAKRVHGRRVQCGTAGKGCVHGTTEGEGRTW
jgi:hypothetical protein